MAPMTAERRKARTRPEKAQPAPPYPLKWTLMTPARAKEFLKNNLNNRNPKNEKIKRYVRDILSGNWHSAAGIIQVGPNGELLNGQNRLMAIVEAGTFDPNVAVWVPVAYDVPLIAQAVMDTGSARTLADALKIQGEANCTDLARALNCYWQYQRGYGIAPGGRTQPTISEALALLAEHPGLRDAVKVAVRIRKGSRFASCGALAALVYVFYTVDPENADTFFDRLNTGAGLSDGDPILLLRNRLAKLSEGTRERGNQDANRAAALTVKAFNAWRQGLTLSRLTWTRGGANAEGFPVVLAPEDIA